MRDHHRRLAAEAEKLGATNIALDTRRRGHPRLIGFDRTGRRFSLVVSFSPSDRRTPLNEIALLRRLLRRSEQA